MDLFNLICIRKIYRSFWRDQLPLVKIAMKQEFTIPCSINEYLGDNYVQFRSSERNKTSNLPIKFSYWMIKKTLFQFLGFVKFANQMQLLDDEKVFVLVSLLH